jgi:uncharacterized protein YdeI (YjbR/CyaY-like superfamily)
MRALGWAAMHSVYGDRVCPCCAPPAQYHRDPRDTILNVKKQRFKATLEKGDRSLGWTIARVPFAPRDVWPQMVRLRVKGEVNGFAFRSSLFPLTDGGGYYLLVNAAMQRGAEASVGASAEFVLEPDLDERPAELPDELAVLLDDEPSLREWYDELSEYTRRELGKWVLGVKGDEARLRRAAQAAERLLASMEGEKELPPVIAAAFRRRPKAKAGWERLNATQRRNELMAVFYYQSVEARAKRVEKLCELAERKAAGN